MGSLGVWIGKKVEQVLGRFETLTEDHDGRLRLFKVERELIWIRRLTLLAWGLALYAENRLHIAGTALLLSGFLYMEGFHWYLHRAGNTARLTRITAAADSILAFTMALTVGGSASPFIPLFYLTIVAAAFRFGARASVNILLLNLFLFLSLVASDLAQGHPVSTAPYVLLYMGVAFALGAMLSNWAAANLHMAINRARDLGRERDRSLSILRRLMNAQEEERRTLSEDLHDRMGERLFSLGHGLDACIAADIPETVRTQLVGLRRELSSCTSDMRAFMNELRPNVLDELGLCEAVVEYVSSIRAIVPFEIVLDLDPDLASWRSRQDAMLFRLIQEAILNARKHSGASRLDIRLKREQQGTSLIIFDNGCGFDPQSVPAGHFGLMMMRERAEASGGELKIESTRNAGTRIIIRYGDDHGSTDQGLSHR